VLFGWVVVGLAKFADSIRDVHSSTDRQVVNATSLFDIILLGDWIINRICGRPPRELQSHRPRSVHTVGIFVAELLQDLLSVSALTQINASIGTVPQKLEAEKDFGLAKFLKLEALAKGVPSGVD